MKPSAYSFKFNGLLKQCWINQIYSQSKNPDSCLVWYISLNNKKANNLNKVETRVAWIIPTICIYAHSYFFVDIDTKVTWLYFAP